MIIVDDLSADEAIQEIHNLRADLVRWEAFYKQQLDTASKSSHDKILRIQEDLIPYFDTVERHVTPSGQVEKYALPSGGMRLTRPKLEYRHDDAAALLEWAKEQLDHPEYIKQEPAWDKIKAHIKETGEIPDGVELYMTEERFEVV